MSALTALIVGAIAGAVIMFLVVARAVYLKSSRQIEKELAENPAPRLHENCRSALLAEPTPLNDGVDISMTLTKEDIEGFKSPSGGRHVKVYQRRAGDTFDDRTKVYYGQRFSARIFDYIELVDMPKNEADQAWIREHLMTRIAPGGKLRLSKDMVPHGPGN